MTTTPDAEIQLRLADGGPTDAAEFRAVFERADFTVASGGDEIRSALAGLDLPLDKAPSSDSMIAWRGDARSGCAVLRILRAEFGGQGDRFLEFWDHELLYCAPDKPALRELAAALIACIEELGLKVVEYHKRAKPPMQHRNLDYEVLAGKWTTDQKPDRFQAQLDARHQRELEKVGNALSRFAHDRLVLPSLPPENIAFDAAGEDWIALVSGPRRYSSTLVRSDGVRGPELPCTDTSIVRRIDDERAVVVQARSSGGITGWIVRDTDITAELEVQDAVEDVLVTDDFVVVTFFDESYGLGVWVYNFEGNMVLSYSRDIPDAADAFDVYAACVVEGNRIAFCAYTDFDFVLLDLETHDHRKYATPKRTHGSQALTVCDETVWFLSPYSDTGAVWQWRIGNREAKRVGRLGGRIAMRGLPGGRLLIDNNDGYAIVNLAAQFPQDPPEPTTPKSRWPFGRWRK